MAKSVNSTAVSAPRAIGEIRPSMAKADLPPGENVDFLKELGRCLNSARLELDWDHATLAGRLKRDEKQVGRWMRGEERTQVDVVFSVPELREPFVVALAKLARMKVTTTIERAA